MAKNRGKRHIERFVAAVAGDDEELAESLIELLSPADNAALLALAESDDPDACWWGVRALAETGDGEAVPVVLARLQHADPAVRAAAALALAKIHSRHPQAVVDHLSHLMVALHDANALVRQAAMEGLAQCGDAAVDLLAEALDGEPDAVRVQAAKALHRIGTLKTAPPLYRHLADPNPLVRHHAMETLTSLGLLETLLLGR